MLVRDLVPTIRATVALAVLVTGGLETDAAEGSRSVPPPVPRKTREELVREWDLNSDGKIDLGEAEVAASRMRRERAELRLNSGIDPVTGLPRGETFEPPVSDAAPETDDAATEQPPGDEAEADRDAGPRLPGTRVPRPQISGTGSAAAKTRTGVAAGPLAGTRAAADAQRRILTGGARAGGLPARPGYGAGIPAAPLNAGLPIVPRTAASPPQRPRGGLVPSMRPAPTVPPQRPAGSRDLYDPY